MTLRAFLLGVAGTGLALGLSCAGASADCVSAKPGNPYEQHYTLTVENRCKAPVDLAVCWRWQSGAEPRTYRLSHPGSVTFLGPDEIANQPASTIWLRCNGPACAIACAPEVASAKPATPAVPAPPAPAPAAPPPNQWGAMAAGLDGAGINNTGHVGVGWAVGVDEASAQKAALAQCQNQGIVSCKIVDLYNEGCGYITTGNNGTGGYGWGTGATAARALAVCSSQGLACQKPIGGCVH